MGIQKRRPIREKKAPKPPLSEGQASAPVQVNPAPVSDPNAPTPPGTHTSKWARGSRKSSLAQKILIVGIILSAAFLTYSLVSSPFVSKTPPQANGVKPPPPIAETNATLDSSLRSTSQAPDAQKDAARLPGEQPSDRYTENAVRQSLGLLTEDSIGEHCPTEGGATAKDELTEPLSLQLAEGHYTAKDYDKAYEAYARLRQNLPPCLAQQDSSGGLVGQNFELVRDFLQLRMALCLEKKGDFDRANQTLKAVSESRSIALRVIANYHIALLEINAGQYLMARTRAYKAISLTSALSFDCEWALMLEQECHFLAAEAVTRQVLSLCDADKDLPRQLWSQPIEKDPLAGLNETQLQTILTSGIERLNGGLLAPQIHAVEPSPGSPGLNRWLVVCNGPGIEELMARFAANAALEVKWVRHTDAAAGTEQQTTTRPSPSKSGWNRPVTLYLPAATTQQVVATAAGAVGLLAQLDNTRLGEDAAEVTEEIGAPSPASPAKRGERSQTGTATITDPTEYSALSEHTRMLNENAIWLWRRLLLMYSNDRRIPNAHFALGVLQDQKGQAAEAIAEYKLVANRYSQTPLAPFALLRSSRIKTDLRDYAGASRDLKELIEQYPDNDLIDRAHLNLAETTMKAGLYDEACSLYKKVYYIGFSAESKAVAVFGAGKCSYQINDYNSTVKWLTRYLETVARDSAHVTRVTSDGARATSNKTDADLYTAYLLLGKANLALGNLRQGCKMLGYTVRRATASDDYVEAISALVETQIKQRDFVAALSTIENVRAWPFSQEQATRLLVLKSSVLREIGLTDQAIALLADKARYLTDQQLKASIILELARCYVAAQNLDLARAHFIEAISLAEPGPFAQQGSLELAEVCLKLGEYQQTISNCTLLLDSSASEQIKQQCSKILASAYGKQEYYDKAAVSLLTASNRQ